MLARRSRKGQQVTYLCSNDTKILRVEMLIHVRMLVIKSSTIACPEAQSPQRLHQQLAVWLMKTGLRSSAIMLVYLFNLATQGPKRTS